MNRTIVSACILLLAGYGSAYGQSADWWKLSPAEREALLTPKPVATVAIRPPAPVPGRTVTIGFDRGGVLTEYETRWRALGARGDLIAIMDGCESACTMVIAFVPRDRLCFGPDAYLAFHQARHTGTTKVALHATRWMYDHYPPDIQAWIYGMGGYEAMPDGRSFWILLAKELWQMGYRRCK